MFSGFSEKNAKDFFVNFSIIFHFKNFSTDLQQKLILQVLNYLTTYDNHQRILILYSFFRLTQISRVFDIVIDCFLSINNDQFEWIIKP